MNQNLTSFESGLLDELQQHAGRRRAAAKRRRSVAIATAAVAAVAVVAVSASVLGTPVTAYAVTEQGDGDVVISIRELADEGGLERQLREHGINATVDYSAALPGVVVLPDGDTAAQTPVPLDGTAMTGEAALESTPDGTVSVGALCDLPADALPGLERTEDGIRITVPAEWSALDETLAISTSSDAGFDGMTVNAGGACSIAVVTVSEPGE